MGCSTASKQKVTKVSIREMKRGPVPNINPEIESSSKQQRLVAFSTELNENLLKTNDAGVIFVPPNSEEKMSLVYVERNSFVKFEVYGEWQLLKDFGLCGPEGYVRFSETADGYPIGALMCRIGGSEWFNINNRFSFQSKFSGPLYFKSNNSALEELKMEGLKVKLTGGSALSFEEIENLSGWNYKELMRLSSEESYTFAENYVLYYLNKVRMNPKLFAEQYILPYVEQSKYAKEVFDKMQHVAPLPPIKVCGFLSQAASFHSIDLGETGNVGHNSSNGDTFKVRIDKFCKYSYCGENISYGVYEPASIIVSQLIDEGLPSKNNRFNLLNGMFDSIGISQKKHSIQKIVTVIVFGQK